MARIFRWRFAGGLSLLALVVVLATQQHPAALLVSAVVVDPAAVEDEALNLTSAGLDAPDEPTVRGQRSAPPEAIPRPPAMPERSPSAEGMRDAPIAAIDNLMRRAIEGHLFPGAAVVVARHGAIVKRQAYGYAALYAGRDQPLESPVPANNDTIFDVASLSKLFTASAVMKLVESGALNIDSPVADYVPQFAANGKERVTVKHLLTHTGGLPEGIKLAENDGRQEVLQKAFNVRPKLAPDTKRLYSDIDFIMLGEIVQRASGIGLDRFIAEQITGPLGMVDTMYLPPDTLLPRIAATELLPPRGMIRGSVHDPVAWHMGGISGHAGIVSTASDLAVFGQMMLNRGAYADRRILAPDSVAAMTRLQVPDSFDDDVGLGWELNQGWYMGGLNAPTTFGHTGYTGSSIVVDPREQVVVVLLTNRVHPVAKASINSTRRQLADQVAAAVRTGVRE